jgi:hypothetical protein
MHCSWLMPRNGFAFHQQGKAKDLTQSSRLPPQADAWSSRAGLAREQIR